MHNQKALLLSMMDLTLSDDNISRPKAAVTYRSRHRNDSSFVQPCNFNLLDLVDRGSQLEEEEPISTVRVGAENIEAPCLYVTCKGTAMESVNQMVNLLIHASYNIVVYVVYLDRIDSEYSPLY